MATGNKGDRSPLENFWCFAGLGRDGVNPLYLQWFKHFACAFICLVERGIDDSSTGGAMGVRMETSTSVSGGGDTLPAVAPAVVGSHLNRSSKTVQQIFETHRSRLYELTVNADLGIRSEELELHFASMPLRYWPRVDGESLRWHLEIIHEFVDGLTRSDVLLAPPVMHWRHFPDR